MSNWLDKIMPSKIRSESKQRTGVPEGLWKKCPKCGRESHVRCKACDCGYVFT